jgi:hypothetical protein
MFCAKYDDRWFARRDAIKSIIPESEHFAHRGPGTIPSHRIHIDDPNNSEFDPLANVPDKSEKSSPSHKAESVPIRCMV